MKRPIWPQTTMRRGRKMPLSNKRFQCGEKRTRKFCIGPSVWLSVAVPQLLYCRVKAIRNYYTYILKKVFLRVQHNTRSSELLGNRRSISWGKKRCGINYRPCECSGHSGQSVTRKKSYWNLKENEVTPKYMTRSAIEWWVLN